jgi:MerR family transcriptional regulator, light-induced transcriptional regulator
MAADFLESAGFEVFYLGASVPVPSLVSLVRARTPDLVVLSAATSLCYPTLQRAITDIGEATGGTVPILVGGAAFTMSDACPLPEHVVYAGRDATQLVEIAREVVGR